MDKAQTSEMIVDQVRAHLRKSSTSDSVVLQQEVANFLSSKELKQVEVFGRQWSKNEVRLYLRFSFDNSVIENAIVTKTLNSLNGSRQLASPPAYKRVGASI